MGLVDGLAAQQRCCNGQNQAAGDCQVHLLPLNNLVRLKFVLDTARIHRVSLEGSQNARSDCRFNPNPLPKSLSDS